MSHDVRIWPRCHYCGSVIYTVPVEKMEGGGIRYVADCCGHRDTLVVPPGHKVQATVFGLRVVTLLGAPVVVRPIVPPTEEPPKEVDAVKSRFGLLEVD